MSLFLCAQVGRAAVKKHYDLPAGEAVKTLKLFSEQSGEQIVYPVEQVRGVRTKLVRGEFTAREALDAMLAGSNLMTVQDAANGALAVKKKTEPRPPQSAPRPKVAAVVPMAPAAASRSIASIVDEIVTLSPFEVSATTDQGYAAATSLAGNRLATDLRDVGAAVTVVTAQLLRDIGATNNETLLQYTTNTEVGNIYGNMANAGSGTQLDETSKFANPNQNTRIRGLASADTTVDYFLTDIPWDSYNVDRIDFQRGPNSILFGLGSPAGIINATTRGATFTNKGSLEAKVSRFGSVRTTFGYNFVVVPRQLGVRIDALWNKEKFQQDPAFQNDKRVSAALRYEPGFLNRGSAHTTIKANFEQGRVRSNRPRSLTPGDSVTPWFLTGTSVGYDVVGTPFTYNNLNRKGFDARGLQDTGVASIGVDGRGEAIRAYNSSGGFPSGTPNPFWQPWLGGQFAASYFGNPMAIFSDSESTASTLVNWEPATSRGIGPTGSVDRTITGIPFSRMSSITLYRDVSKKVNLPGAKFGLTRNLSLSDPSVFDFYDQLIDGPNKQEWQNFRRYNASVGQTFQDGAFGFEAVFDQQHYDNGQVNFMTDKGQQIYLDIMRVEADGSSNPNFGRAFVADSGAGGVQSSTNRSAFRFTGYGNYDFDSGEQHTWFTRLLGRQTLTGFYSDDTRRSASRNFLRYVADNAYKDFINGAGSNPVNINSSLRAVYPVIYLGPSLVGASTATGSYLPNPSAEAVVGGGSIRAFDSTWTALTVNPADPWENRVYPVGHLSRSSTQSENPANYRGWVSAPITITDSEAGHRDENTFAATKGKLITESKAINWQGYLWGGAFVGMYGYRDDIARSWATSASRDPEGRAIVDTQVFRLPARPTVVQDTSSSWSGVLHLGTLLEKQLPVNVSVFYNRSTNFQPKAGRVGPLNNPLTPPSGKTIDFGARFSTRDEKYALKVNWYKTSVAQSDGTSGFNSFYLGQLFTDYQSARNVFVFEVTDPTNPATYHAGLPSQWKYQPTFGQSEAQALAAQKADVAGWDALVNGLPPEFLSAWKLELGQTSLEQLKQLSYTSPAGFSIPEDNVSKGTEIELYANPFRGLRLTANASRSESVRNNLGDPAFTRLVEGINHTLATTSAGSLRSGAGATSTTALQNWNANFWASWLSVKGQEGNAVPELRRWRANLVADYEFERGPLKGVSVGMAYRWQDRVIIGYKPVYYVGETVAPNPFVATSAKFDLGQPYYGPSEHNVDVWFGYTRRLNSRLTWRTQFNVRNVGKTESLIPVTVQPDGTPAGLRIAPAMVWMLTNTIEF